MNTLKKIAFATLALTGTANLSFAQSMTADEAVEMWVVIGYADQHCERFDIDRNALDVLTLGTMITTVGSLSESDIGGAYGYGLMLDRLPRSQHNIACHMVERTLRDQDLL